jgi:hypothetical protein
MKAISRLAATRAAIAAVVVSGVCILAGSQPAALDIPFAPIEDTALKDPDNPAKRFRVDFARVEHEFPLTRQHLARLTPGNIKDLTQEEVDQIYGRLTAGPIPNGNFAGDLFFPPGDRVSPQVEVRTRLEEILGGLKGRVVGAGIEALEDIGRDLWKGKQFDRQQGLLRNMIDDSPIITLLTDSPHTAPTTTIPTGRRFIDRFLSNSVLLLFPAKVHCGQSLLDARRESIIVDYNYSEELPAYRPRPDHLAGRGGLKIRDEIRMVRPGFYLGRAYANRMFLLNFTLYDEELAEREAAAFANGAAVAEDCWPGEQARETRVR